MTKAQRNVLYGLAAVAAYIFLIRRQYWTPTAVTEPASGRKATEQERDALARLLWAETSMLATRPPDYPEHAAIVAIALNRATGRYSILDVATPPGRSSAGVWNTGQVFRDRWKDAPNHRSFARARAVVDGVLEGSIPNPIGSSRKLFVHPGGLKRCELRGRLWVYSDSGNAIGARRRCVDGRALPAWSVAKNVSPTGQAPGTAPSTPLVVGRGIFS